MMELQVGLSAFIGGYSWDEHIGYVVHEHVKHFFLGGREVVP